MSQANIDKLERVQNILERVVVGAPRTSSTLNIPRDSHWLSVGHRITYKLCLTTCKTLHTSSLSLSNCLNSFLTIFHPDACILPIQISLPDQPVLLVSNFSSQAFSVSVPSTNWNSLPAHIRSVDTLSTFKRHIKFHLFPSLPLPSNPVPAPQIRSHNFDAI